MNKPVKQKTKSVVTVTGNPAALAERPAAGMTPVPDFMKGQAGDGLEDLGIGDYALPRVILIQNVSEELQTYDGLKPGAFFHTLAERDLGTELPIVLLHVSKRFVLWNPREAGGGILARADDGERWTPPNAEFQVKINKGAKTVTWKTKSTVAESGLADWGTYDPDDPKSQPAATQVYACAVALPTFPELSPSVVLLQRAAIKPARNMLGKLKISRAPAYGVNLTMSSFVDTGPSGPFHNFRFTVAGFVEDEAVFKMYQELHEIFRSKGVQVRDLEKAQDDAPGAADAAAADQEKKF